MSRWCVKVLACSCLLVFSQSSLLAQDGRGSHGGGWRSSTNYYSTPTPYRYYYVYPLEYVVPAIPVQPAVIVPSGPPASPPPAAAPFAKITILAPDSAQIWFDGKSSEAKDGIRVYTSSSIETGKSTPVSVKITMSGSTREMQLTMQAGDAVTIDLRSSH